MNVAERKRAEEKKIRTVVFDLTFSEDRALFAVQKLLDGTDYHGSGPAHMVKTDIYHISSVPTLQVAKADYLRAYGLEPLRSARGKFEFSAGGRKTAGEALKSLSDRSFLIIYERRTGDSKDAVERVERVAPLVQLPTADRGTLSIIPNPVLVDQVDGYDGKNTSGYFMWLPEDLHAQVSGKDVAAVRFMEFIIYQMTRMWRKKRPEIRFQMETVAWWLRLGSMIGGRKCRGLRERLNGYYDLAVRLGYLERYAVDQVGVRSSKVDVFYPNKDFVQELISERDS